MQEAARWGLLTEWPEGARAGPLPLGWWRDVGIAEHPWRQAAVLQPCEGTRCRAAGACGCRLSASLPGSKPFQVPSGGLGLTPPLTSCAPASQAFVSRSHLGYSLGLG